MKLFITWNAANSASKSIICWLLQQLDTSSDELVGCDDNSTESRDANSRVFFNDSKLSDSHHQTTILVFRFFYFYEENETTLSFYDSNIYSTFLTCFIFYHDTQKQYLSDLSGNRSKVIWRKKKKISKTK